MRGGSELSSFRREQPSGLPVRDQRGLEALRADPEEPLAAIIPHEPASFDERLPVENIQQHDLEARIQLFGEAAVRLPSLHGHEIDQPDFLCRLFCEMPAEVGIVHGRDRMARHCRVLMERIAHAVRHREQVSERLIAAHPRIAHDHRLPAAAEDRRSNVDRPPDRPHMRR
jgi:hypothetical protein